MCLQVGVERYDADLIAVERRRGGAERPDSWYLGVPAALWIIDKIASGDISTAEAAQLLADTAKWASGCCSACDAAAESYPEALQLYEAMLAEWQREQDSMTAKTHPSLLNRGRIHALNCSHVEARPPGHPGRDLHSYAAQYDGNNSDLTVMFNRLREGALICHRATVDDVLERLSRCKPTARDPRCKLCAPELPGAWQSEASGAPSAQ